MKYRVIAKPILKNGRMFTGYFVQVKEIFSWKFKLIHLSTAEYCGQHKSIWLDDDCTLLRYFLNYEAAKRCIEIFLEREYNLNESKKETEFFYKSGFKVL